MRGIKQRVLSLVLAVVMVIGMLPIVAPAVVPEAEAATHTINNGTQGDGYISLPITIRDFPADGMLFENNEYDTEDNLVDGVSATREITAAGGGTMPNAQQSGYVRYTSSGTGNYITYTLSGESRASMRYAAIKFRTNAAYSSQPTIGHRASDGDHYVNFTGTYNTASTWQTVVIDLGTSNATLNYVTIFPRLASGKYMDIAYVSFFSTKDAATTYNANGGSSGGDVYHTGNTVGYGMLMTNDTSHHKLLDDETITGTELINYGGYLASPDDMETANKTGQYYTLNSSALQWVHGALIRTNLVETELDANKNLVYTQGAVDYIATYMKATLPEVWQNNDGSYNLWYVMGDKLFDNNNNYVGKGSSATRDLATVLRSQITGMGTYAEAKADYASGALASIQDINSYYDAAYFLLHTTFDDVQGYGMTAPEYKEIRLVQKTKADGTVYYTFNSAYDNTTYNYRDGYIVNSQTTQVTDREAYGQQYTRGNIQALHRFDPLGPSGAGVELGYGMSGSLYNDYYAELGFAQAVTDKPVFYDTTNYNLSLEGHAQFIYYHDDNLYFTFTGDDDVYLYINGTRVLDVGGAHAIGKVTINLNDVASLCELSDGKPYDFDFYYMERHGTAANFGIETNIKIVDPAMLTQKTGYQNGVEVGYNGFVDPQQPVNYCFQLTNNGEAPLKNLEFLDDDIGVSITSSALSYNSETTSNDLLLAVYDANGSVKQYVEKGNLTDEVLMKALADGIAVGERILIHGFKYTIPAEEWVNDTYFHNTVYTTGTAHYQNAAIEELHGIADYRVQKQEYSFEGDHFYTLGELASGDDKVNLKQESTITDGIREDEILAMVQAGVSAEGNKVSATSFDSLQICSASGNTESNKNERAKVSGKTITYSTPVTGTDSFYFKAKSGEVTYGPIRVVVYNYGYADNIYVLDYNLPVELNGTNFGLTTNDELNVDNPYITSRNLTHEITAQQYGTFTLGTPEEDALEACYNGQSLKYEMTDFMSGVDSVNVTLDLREDAAATPDNRTNGVTFTEKVEVAPASVVYYEDDFAGITYVNSETDENGNVWAEYESEFGKGKEQSADQNSNYGSDPNYKNDKKWGKLKLNEDKLQKNILKKLGISYDQDALESAIQALIEKNPKAKKAYEKYMKQLGGTASNGTIHELILSPGTSNSEILYFDFQGTGFELISRATQDLYAVLTVRVYEMKPDGTIDKDSAKPIYYEAGDYNNDGKKTTKNVPVITESEGGDAYEVPIIKIEDLPYSKYRVALYASNVSEADREIYIDGVRIYEPLNDELEDVYYSTDEANAEFSEIRPLVLDETIVYLDLNDNDLTWGTGTTVVEDVGDDETNSIYQAATHGTTDYLNHGPNNEIYLDATAADNTANGNVSLLAFYVTKTENAAEEERTLQIGAHRKINTDAVQNKDGSTTVEDGAVYLVYGSTAEAIAKGIQNSAGETVNYLAIESGTEQYITIDPANLDFDDSGKALVLVGTNGGENAAANILALTNLKVKNYTLTPCGDQIINALNGVTTSELIETGYGLRTMMAAPPVQDEIEDTNPDVSEPEDDLHGFDDPEETEPEETEPEVTEPEETEPEVTEPEETEPEETKPGNGNNKPGNGNNKPSLPGIGNWPGIGIWPGIGSKPGTETTPEETEPEVTEPEETEPEETEPEETTPEETVPEETTPEETQPDKELMIHNVGFLDEQVASGTEAMLYAVVTDNTETLRILDEDGNEVEFTLLDEKDLQTYGLKSAQELLKQFRSGDLKKLNSLFKGFAKEMAERFAAIYNGDFDFKTLPQDSELLMLTLNIEGESGQERTFQVFAVDAEEACSEECQSITITIE